MHHQVLIHQCSQHVIQLQQPHLVVFIIVILSVILGCQAKQTYYNLLWMQEQIYLICLW